MRLRILTLLAFLPLAALAQAPSLKELEKQLKENPQDEEALYDAGLVTYLEGDFKESIDYWERLKKLTPDDWKLRAKLVQAYQGAGKDRKRDEEIAAIRKARTSGAYPELSKENFFIRDQFEVGGIRAFVLEYFELEGERPLVWKFILRKGEERHNFHLSLGSYDSTTAVMRAMGEIKEDERGYHLDGYDRDGSHRTYGIFKKNPGYDATRKMVVNVLEGKLKEQSATVPTGNEEAGPEEKKQE